MTTVLGLLSGMDSFASFSEAQRKALAKLMKLSEVEDGHELTRQGQPGTVCHLLVQGEVVVTRKDEVTGESKDLKVLRPGEIFGILSLLGKIPAAATCRARGAVTVASLPREDYQLLFKVDAPMAYHFQWLVAQQLARDLKARNDALRALLASD
ncbi:MAG: cyclic nucleotide-binding domain-containing protein [Polyangia bacterium]|jgi:CRP-like cAMP-binding protein|nr:cyclic nucleotide-binding domain-containing protein [Polyangia bacterium]